MTDTIAQDTATVMVTPISGLVYNGSPQQTASYSATGVNGALPSTDFSATTVHTNAGTYYDTWTFTDPNYVSQTGSVADHIAQATATIVVTPTPGLVYNAGSQVTATDTATGVGGVNLNSDLTVNSTHTNAGTYTDNWTFIDPNGNYSSETGKVTDTIGQALLTITANPAGSVYGQPVVLDGVTYYGFVNGETSANLTNQPVVQTSATSTSPVSGSPYAITVSGAVDPNYTITNVPNSYTISPATSSFSGLTTSQSIAYGTSEILVSGTLGTASVVPSSGEPVIVSVDSTNTSTDIVGDHGSFSVEISTTMIPVGSYTIAYSYAGDSNFNAAATDTSTSLTVNAASLTITATSASKVYSTTATLACTETGLVNSDTITGVTETSAGAVSTANVGSYPIDVSGAVGTGLSNYIINYVVGTLTVTPAGYTVIISPQTWVYGTVPVQPIPITITGLPPTSGTSGPFQPDFVVGASPSNAGVYQIPVVFNGSGNPGYNANYQTVTAYEQITITSAPLVITANNASGTYKTTPVLNGVSYASFVDGQGPSVLTTLPTVTTTATSTSPVGNYPITASGAVDTSSPLSTFETSASPNYVIHYEPGTYAVTPAIPTMSVADNGGTYNGTTFTATATVNGLPSLENVTPTLDYQEYINGTWTDLGANAPVNAGSYELTANFAGSTDYTVAQSRIVDFSIAKANATIDGVFPYNVVYDGQLHTASGAVWGVNGIGLSLDLSGTTHINVGTYIDTWTFTDTTGNYNNTSGTVVDAITPATARITVVGYNTTYTGEAQTATSDAIGVNNTAIAGLVLNTTHIDVGTCSDTWTFSNPNYFSANGTVVDTINKANATITVPGYYITYDGNPHTATGTAIGVLGERLSGLDLAGITHTNAGTYTDTWTFTDVTGNYNDTSGTVVDTINKANANFSILGYNTFYNASTHSATGAVYGVNAATLAGLNLSGTTHTAVGTYTDVWTFTDTTGNYNNASGVVADTVTPSKSKMVRETVLVPEIKTVKATVLVPGIKEVKAVDRLLVNGKWIKKTVLVPETVMVKKTVLVNEIKMVNKTEMVKVYYS